MMKTYEILAVSYVAGRVGFQDGIFFFEVEATNKLDAGRKFDEMCKSPELAWKELRIDRIEDKAERQAFVASLEPCPCCVEFAKNRGVA